LKLPAELARNLYFCVAAVSVGLVLTFAATIVSNWYGAFGSSKENTMENKLAHGNVVRSSVLSTIGSIGTAAIGGFLAA
jgi:hypothetical protein